MTGRPGSGAAGYSLIEVLLAAMLAGLMTVGTTTLMTNLQGTQNSVQYALDTNNLIESVRTNLSSPQTCLNTLGGLIVTSGASLPVTTIQADPAAQPQQFTYTAGTIPTEWSSGRIQSFTLTNFVPGSVWYQGQMTLNTRVVPAKTSLGVQSLERGIVINIGLDNFRKIISCSALSKLATAIWQPAPLNVGNIYFDNDGRGGAIGVNSTAPASPLDVAGPLRVSTRGHRKMPESLIPNTEGSDGDYEQGLGFNFLLDYGNPPPLNWKSGGDGVNTGAAVILLRQSEGDLRFHTFPTIKWRYGATFTSAQVYANEYMRLTSDGNLALGLTAPTFRLQLSTRWAAKPGSAFWTVASDERLKDLRGSFTRGLSAVNGIVPRHFTYRADNPLHLPSDEAFVGVAAQVVRRHVPEAVTEGPSDYLHVTNDAVQWTMLNAIRELRVKNQILREHIAELRRRRRRGG